MEKHEKEQINEVKSMFDKLVNDLDWVKI
jgi:hypothetical protein